MIWALVGVLLAALALTTWGRWILSSEEFGRVEVLGPDEFPTWRLVLLRISEVASVVEMSTIVYLVAIRPWRRARRLGIEAKIALGCFLGSVSDGFLNTQEYLFAWNQHSINVGSWSSFLPFADPDHQSRYAEGIVWGTPMYMYFCIGVALVAVPAIQRMRRRWPGIRNGTALSVVFVAACVFDFVVENVFIRLDHGYAYAQAPESVTLFAGSQYQFPLYEMVLVAALGVFFTNLLLSARDSPDGRSWAERGVERLAPRWRGPASWLAVIGASMTAFFLVYHLPFNWLGLVGDSAADLPSYLLPSR
ncbi:MAG: spirocyclase AveC family protein [Solirubrobacteraceae bacterium]|nr:spirocyclase AveC family protein [Solirubrobacteraceae bacterium]